MENQKNNEEKEIELEFINPIDVRKTAENPGLLPYAHTAGGAVIKPTEQGVIKGKAMSAMEQQTDKQMRQLYEQMQTLSNQAKEIQDRIEISKYVYEAEIPFQPVIGHTYFLYLRESGKYFLSMITPDEWGKTKKFQYISQVSLLADHTWDVLDTNWKS
ncbi:MAG: DUF2452 domain-containing protein [Bacteroidetes bacterium]|nr:MAG: DUF2452 domain-containing protein [Bacteroidota bacterium]TAG86650.1 MAG: DUF2452 domain-containing protein [Bacteroidota bacterium]